MANHYRSAADVLADAGATLEVADAAIVLGIDRSHAYALIRTNRWPTRVLMLGRKILLPTAEIRRLVGLPAEPVREAVGAR